MRFPSTRPGLVLLGLLSAVDVVSLPLGDGKHPPLAVLVFGAVLGVLSLVLVTKAWRDPLAGLRLLVLARALSALTAVPAFLVGGVPTAAKVAAGVFMGLTALGIALVTRQPQLELAP